MTDDFEKIKNLLKYDQETGLIWRNDTGISMKNTDIPAGTLTKNKYISVSVNSKRYYAHRLAWLLTYGEWPDGQIDHINHIRNDNRIDNLRCVSHKENTKNKSITSKNSSGVVGVYFHKRAKKWYAQISVNREVKFLGSFELIEDAKNARKIGEKEYGFHPNHGCDK